MNLASFIMRGPPAPETDTAACSAKPRQTYRGFVRALFGLSLLMVAYGITRSLIALGNPSGSVAPADQQALASARARLSAQVRNRGVFRLELTEEEITALLQDQLAEVGAPFHRVVIDVVDGEGEAGHIEFNATFSNGKLAMHGRLDVVLDAGALRVELREVDVGAINVPGIAKGALEDLINPFAERALTKSGAEIQSVTLADDKLIVVGVQRHGQLLSSATVNFRVRRQSASTTRAAKTPRILRDLRRAVPDATVIFLQTYNPISFGFGSRVALEDETNRTIGEFNSVAARVAQSHGILVADGFTPMQGTAAITTHMLDNPPDIHPRAIGFDILAAALLDALPKGSHRVDASAIPTRL